MQENVDVVIIGAGPSGSVASALLNKQGYDVLVLEQAHFPRFSIGESLLPQSMAFLEEAGFMEAVQAHGFQFKNGAVFSHGNRYDAFDFTEKFSPGWGTTFQVQRDAFDKILADEAEKQGVTILYGQTVTDFSYDDANNQATVSFHNEQGQQQVKAKFVLDASGYGRVLPRILGLDKPSSFEDRTSIFTHVQDHIVDDSYDREKVLITVHPAHKDVWFWLIPFSDGHASLGVVGPKSFIDNLAGEPVDQLKQMVSESGWMAGLLANAQYEKRVGVKTGFACDVTNMYGPGFALLGNAGEFLDPIFSSGVTVAVKSASLAAHTVDLALQGKQPDWQQSFVTPLRQGVDTFKAFVTAWYDGTLQDVIFSEAKNEGVKRMISSILAGYAWDTDNPYVKDVTRLKVLAELCRNES